MKKVLDLIDELKTSVMLAQDLTQPMDCYHYLLENDDVFKMGVVANPAEIMEMCKIAAAVAYHKPPQVFFNRIIHIAECHFYHGAAMVNGNIALLVYFTDIGRGVLAATERGETKMMRISKVKATMGENVFVSHPAEPATD